MSYSANIPPANQAQKDSQPLIQANFNAIATVVAVNHVPFDDPSGNQGMHNFAQFPVQSSTPGAPAGIVTLFSRTSAITGNAELAFENAGGGAIYEFTSGALSASGWTRLASGVLLKWGNFATIPGAQTINFPVAANIPVFSAIFQVLITTKVAGASDTYVLLNSFNTTSMTVYSSNRTSTGTAVSGFTYLAIGT